MRDVAGLQMAPRLVEKHPSERKLTSGMLQDYRITGLFVWASANDLFDANLGFCTSQHVGV
jgi:hypothetical protein